MQTLQLYQIIPQTRALGYKTRFAIWVQGCPFRCVGCMTPDSLSLDGGYITKVNTLATLIHSVADIEGLTITGGEPFLQSAALSQLIQQVTAKRDLGIIVYSGYTRLQLEKRAKNDKAVHRFLNQIDLLIDAPYEAEHNEGTTLRGSSNQGLHLLTPRYQPIINSLYKEKKRAVEIHVLQEHSMLVGIPDQQSLQHWQQKLKG